MKIMTSDGDVAELTEQNEKFIKSFPALEKCPCCGMPGAYYVDLTSPGAVFVNCEGPCSKSKETNYYYGKNNKIRAAREWNKRARKMQETRKTKGTEV